MNKREEGKGIKQWERGKRPCVVVYFFPSEEKVEKPLQMLQYFQTTPFPHMLPGVQLFVPTPLETKSSN